MSSILLVVEKPKEKSAVKEDNYHNAIEKIQQVASTNTNIQPLGDNVLLISIDKTLEPLSEVIRSLSDVPYKYIIFHEELEWHPV